LDNLIGRWRIAVLSLDYGTGIALREMETIEQFGRNVLRNHYKKVDKRPGFVWFG
jgi:hypothetical protein